MSLYGLKEVRVVGDVSELNSALFTAEEDDFVMPDPATALLFTQEEAERKATINDLLCHKGEETISEVMKEILDNSKVFLVVVKMNIVKAEGLIFHPLFRLKELPTLMSLDGVLRLSRSDVSNRLLVWDFFEALLSSDRDDRPAKVFLEKTAPDYAPQQLFSPQAGEGRLPHVLPLESVCFWDVKEAARARAEVAAQLAGYSGLTSEEDTRLLEAKIREEFSLMVPAKEVPPGWEEPEEEAIVPLDLEDLVMMKETLEIERKGRPQSPTKSNKSKKSSTRKSKKSSERNRKRVPPRNRKDHK